MFTNDNSEGVELLKDHHAYAFPITCISPKLQTANSHFPTNLPNNIFAFLKLLSSLSTSIPSRCLAE